MKLSDSDNAQTDQFLWKQERILMNVHNATLEKWVNAVLYWLSILQQLQRGAFWCFLTCSSLQRDYSYLFWGQGKPGFPGVVVLCLSPVEMNVQTEKLVATVKSKKPTGRLCNCKVIKTDTQMAKGSKNMIFPSYFHTHNRFHICKF